MSDINSPIQIPSELNVPETKSDNESEPGESIQSKSAITTSATSKTQSAESKTQSNHRSLRSNHKKSQSMQNFPNTSLSIDNDNDPIKSKRNAVPKITLSPASTKLSIENHQIDSLDQTTENRIMGDTIHDPNELKLNANRKRKSNSLPVPEQQFQHDDEFDELKPNHIGGSQLRIRSSIISLFGRMGKQRRSSTISQNSTHENGTENTEHVSSLRNLPHIAATRILRAFSYVGKQRVIEKLVFFSFSFLL